MFIKPIDMPAYILNNTNYLNYGNPAVRVQGSIPKKAILHFKCYYFVNDPTYAWILQLEIGNSTVVNLTNIKNTTPQLLEWTSPAEITAGTSFKLYLGSNYSSTTIYCNNTYLYYINEDIIPYWPALYPTEIKGPWEKTAPTLYWIKPGGGFVWGVGLLKDTSATTWTITPGNFVGYIKVRFNGEYIKIPYYNN